MHLFKNRRVPASSFTWFVFGIALLLAGCGGGGAGHDAGDASLEDAKGTDGTVGLPDSTADSAGRADATQDSTVVMGDAEDEGRDTDSEGAAQDTGTDAGVTPDTALPSAYTIGGSVSGLGPGATIVLEDNGGDSLSLATNGEFLFSSSLPSGASYAVTILTQPGSQQCTVSGGVGVVGSANVMSVVVNCASNTYTVGGTVTGLLGSVVLQNNGGDNDTLSANGTFAFATPLATGAAFDVTIQMQPGAPAQTCTVMGGTGTVASANVLSVAVTCVTTTFTVGGTITGLAAGDSLTLEDNGVDNLIRGSNGSFTFAMPVSSGSPYVVTVLSQPTAVAQTCTVTMGNGTVGAANVTSVAVTCATASFLVSGTLTGLAAGNSVVIQDNGGDDLTLTADGPFAFASPLASGTMYTVTVKAQPSNPSQTCVVSAAMGTVNGGNASSVVVNCASNTFTVGGTVSGLAPGDSVALEDNGTDTTFVTSNGNFAFAKPIGSGSTYTVTVKSNPSTPVSQTCSAVAAMGTVASGDVTTVAITCSTNAFAVGGTVSGLLPTTSGVYLLDNGGDMTMVNVNGSFAFPTRVPSGTPYTVQVLASPAYPPAAQTCTVMAGTGTIAAGPVSNVSIACTTNTYPVGGTILFQSPVAPGDSITLQLTDTSSIPVTVQSLVVTTTSPGFPAFAFPTQVTSGDNYTVTVTRQPQFPPQMQTCSFGGSTPAMASGTVGGGAVTSVTVGCVANAYALGGTITGLAGADDVTISATLDGGSTVLSTTSSNGATSFSFPPQPSGTAYVLSVTGGSALGPISQTCAVTGGGSGTVQNSAPPGIAVACTTNSFLVNGTISGLSPGDAVGLSLTNSEPPPALQSQSFSANGSFNFTQRVLSGAMYTALVTQSPASPTAQVCVVVSGGTGSVGGADVAPGSGPQILCTLPNGDACTTGNQCTSGNCEESVCCAASCSDQGSSSCGTNGACNAAGTACSDYPPGTLCALPTCSGGMQTTASLCNGTGTCTHGVTSSCGPYVCGATACKTSCAAPGDCTPGNTCSGTACVPLETNGSACTSGGQCLSGNCEGSVCCAVACVASSQSSCGETGACNAAGTACADWAPGTQCAAPTCSGGTQVLPGSCNGSGACTAGTSSGCGAYVCGATACKTSCASSADCSAGNYCSGTACVPTETNGGACSTGNQCTSGNCEQSVCCASACTASAASTCGQTGACSAGGGACADWAPGTVCAPATCSDGPASSTETAAGTCNGTGSCLAGASSSCGNYKCGGTSCKTSCTGSGDCVAGQTCTGGICGSLLSNGATCSAGPQCSSGNCEGNICCSTSCGDEGAVICGENGACNPSGVGCANYPAGTVCNAAKCVQNDSPYDTTETATAYTCDGTGDGDCNAVATSCGQYTCNAGATACNTVCATNNDCIRGDDCNASHQCVPSGLSCTKTFAYTGAPQSMTVTLPGVYTITGNGAQGGKGGAAVGAGVGGLGANAQGQFSLTLGAVVQVIVGGRPGGPIGTDDSGAGGGGTYVFLSSSSSLLPAEPLIVAGGGAGGKGGNGTYPGATDTPGAGGFLITLGGGGGGGAGWNQIGFPGQAGGQGGLTGSGGGSWAGGAGVSGESSAGGFGGGGGAGTFESYQSGGGGGYNGGAGGSSLPSPTAAQAAGGGSYVDSSALGGSAAGASGANGGNGSVTIYGPISIYCL